LHVWQALIIQMCH